MGTVGKLLGCISRKQKGEPAELCSKLACPVTLPTVARCLSDLPMVIFDTEYDFYTFNMSSYFPSCLPDDGF